MTSGTISVVTGAARGIGRATAQRLALRGDRVYVLDIHENEGDDLTTDAGTLLACDVTSQQQVEETVRRIEREEGRVDVLVNNAGGFPVARRLEELTLEEWNRSLELNLTSVFLVTKAFLPLLRRADAARVLK
ncbi:MAG: SDR family NAD(P)-dependent oxidoreductase, partial [Acidimicrobiia bacterium]